MCSLTSLVPTKLGVSSFDYPPSSHHVDSFFSFLPSSSSHQSLQWKAEEMDNYRRPSITENNNKNGNSNTNSHCSDNRRGDDDDDDDHLHHHKDVDKKKLNHNASERDRRKKLNALFSTLRSLLPAADQKKKLSIPATLSRALKYIPEQQQEVERLSRRKEEIMKRILRQNGDSDRQDQKRRGVQTTSALLPGIVVTKLCETEIAVQISTVKRIPVSDVLFGLEGKGLRVISASSLLSSSTRLFHSLHLEIEKNCEVKLEELNEMLMALFEKPLPSTQRTLVG